MFLTVGALGKLSFFGLITSYSITDELPVQAAVGSSGDLIFAIVFIYWLVRPDGGTSDRLV